MNATCAHEAGTDPGSWSTVPSLAPIEFYFLICGTVFRWNHPFRVLAIPHTRRTIAPKYPTNRLPCWGKINRKGRVIVGRGGISLETRPKRRSTKIWVRKYLGLKGWRRMTILDVHNLFGDSGHTHGVTEASGFHSRDTTARGSLPSRVDTPTTAIETSSRSYRKR
jgi:hypothetical protein